MAALARSTAASAVAMSIFSDSSERYVLWINAKLALRPGQRHHLYVLGINLFLRCYDLELERGHGESKALAFLNRIHAALHVKILLGHVVMFAVENFFKTADCFCNRHVLPFETSENFCHVKWLA